MRPTSSTILSAQPQVKRIYAKREVIVSGGVFNTPQLLKLSGIGPARELQRKLRHRRRGRSARRGPESAGPLRDHCQHSAQGRDRALHPLPAPPTPDQRSLLRWLGSAVKGWPRPRLRSTARTPTTPSIHPRSRGPARRTRCPTCSSPVRRRPFHGFFPGFSQHGARQDLDLADPQGPHEEHRRHREAAVHRSAQDARDQLPLFRGGQRPRRRRSRGGRGGHQARARLQRGKAKAKPAHRQGAIPWGRQQTGRRAAHSGSGTRPGATTPDAPRRSAAATIRWPFWTVASAYAESTTCAWWISPLFRNCRDSSRSHPS